MAKIIFYRCEENVRKLAFIKLLIDNAGLSMMVAKNMADKLVDNKEIIEVEIADEKLARQVLEEAKTLKIFGKVEY